MVVWAHPGVAMARLVEFELPDGDMVLVEVAEPMQVPIVRGMDSGTVAERAQMTFETAVGRIKPAVQGMIGQLHALSEQPDEVTLAFGIDLHADAGAFVAHASADANFSVILTWRHHLPGEELGDDDGQ